MSKINTNKPVATRDGRKAYIVAEGLVNDYIGVVVVQGNSEKYLRVYPADGRILTAGANPEDLVNIPEKCNFYSWINIYPDGIQDTVWRSKEAADHNAGKNRLACIYVERPFLEGEGL